MYLLSIVIPRVDSLETGIELLFLKLSSPVVRLRVGAVLASLDVGDPDPEERVGQPGLPGAVIGACRVGEPRVDYEDGNEGEDGSETQGVEAPEGVLGPDDSVKVRIEEDAVLGENVF